MAVLQATAEVNILDIPPFVRRRLALPAGAPAPNSGPWTYLMRAWDSGTAGYVWWTTLDPTATPAAGDTTPNYTGSLSASAIERRY